MKDRLTVTTRDLARLLAVTDASHEAPGVDGVPESVLAAIHELVPCDNVSYNRWDHRRADTLIDREVGDPGEFDEGVWEEGPWLELFGFDSPQPKVDAHVVKRSTDSCSSEREYFASPYGYWSRRAGWRFDMLVPLNVGARLDNRIILIRHDGRDFSERELLLLRLLRPHLAELDRRAFRRARLPLTDRQIDVLRLVADGLTNRQIARHLQLSEGTVRTHLEHVFSALGVQSRAAAVAALATSGILSA